MACQLTAGERELAGGRIFQTDHWVVEHCVGTLGVGALILKPLRHIVALADMSDAEAAELGPLMQRASSIIRALTDADQVYACLWSHAEWTPGHIHFVLQPAWNALRSRYPGPGPALQMAMFTEASALDPDAVQSFCARARSAFALRAAAEPQSRWPLEE
jgi:diadenosine tetraphosphate (Ap4A) HIT family hydrolase